MLPLVSSQSSINSFLPCPRPQLVGGANLTQDLLLKLQQVFGADFWLKLQYFVVNRLMANVAFLQTIIPNMSSLGCQNPSKILVMKILHPNPSKQILSLLLLRAAVESF